MSERDQPDLFDEPPYARGSDTSREAAESVAPLTGKWRVMVYGMIARRGDHGATCWECEQILGRAHQNISARIWELRHSGWIKDSGDRRPTGSRRNAVVWVKAR